MELPKDINLPDRLLRFDSEQDEARNAEWLEIILEAQEESNRSSAVRLEEILRQKGEGKMSEEEFERECFECGQKSMTEALRIVLAKHQ